MTVSLDDKGHLTDTSGSWLAGEDGARPGIFMEAQPTVGHSFRQEYYPGQAEDQFTVVDLRAKVSVPYGSFDETLLTEETTVLEPGIGSQMEPEAGSTVQDLPGRCQPREQRPGLGVEPDQRLVDLPSDE